MASGFRTLSVPVAPDRIAPDGSQVRLLLALENGSMAHFTLSPGEISRAAVHRTVDEIWLFLAGHGQMWRRHVDHEETVAVGKDVCISLPVGTRFQFRCDGSEPLVAVGVTMPPWPGEAEAEVVAGPWAPRLRNGVP